MTNLKKATTNYLINVLVRMLVPNYTKEENMVSGRVEGAVVEEVEDNNPKAAKLEIIDMLCLDPADWTIESLSAEESELGLAHGEGYLNDFMRMHDEMGISASHIDKERQLALDTELLDIYRSYVGQVYYDLKKVDPTADWTEEAITLYLIDNEELPAHEEKLVRRTDAYLWEESEDAIRIGKWFAKDVIERTIQMDKDCDRYSDLFEYIKVVDELESQADALLGEETEEQEDYNKVHWNLCENFWDRVIVKVERMTSVEKPSMKQIQQLQRMYAKINRYKWGKKTTVDGVKRQVGGQEISSRHYWEIRYLISSYLFSVAKNPDNVLHWAEKAEKDQNSLSKCTGSKNVLGENIPDSYFKEVDIDDLMKDEEPRMTGRISAPNEDQLIEALDRKYFGVRPERRERNSYTAPTGANNVDVADAMFVLVRLISHELVHARTCELDATAKAACYKAAAEELEVSMSTLRRRIKHGKELLSNSHLSTSPEVTALISLV